MPPKSPSPQHQSAYTYTELYSDNLEPFRGRITPLPSVFLSSHACKRANTMDEGTIKTQNPQCRLYWCLIELIDWRYSPSCWYFRPLL
jgi:hypothetical protein